MVLGPMAAPASRGAQRRRGLTIASPDLAGTRSVSLWNAERGRKVSSRPRGRELRRSGPGARPRPLPWVLMMAMTMAGCGFLKKKPVDTPAQIAARASEDARILREVE